MGDSDQRYAEVVRLYDESSPELVRLLHGKLGNRQEAEEIAQDAFEKLCELADRSDIEDIRKYFFTMANRMALNILRRRDVERNFEQRFPGEEGSSAFDPETIARHRERLSLTQAALRKLPSKTRHVFLLHRFEDYSHSQIAKHIGLSQKSVEYHISQALRAIRTALEET